MFGFSKLDVIFGRKSLADVFHPYSDLDKPGLRFVQSTIRSIDPLTKHVETMPVLSTPTSWSSLWERTYIRRPPRGWWRVATTSTRWRGRWLCVRRCRASAGVE